MTNTEIIGRYTEIMGHRLFSDFAGEGNDRSMLLIHTAGQHAIQWRFVIPYFAARGYRVLAPDLPGHGKSLPAGDKPITSVHEFAEVLWALAEKFDLSDPVVIGCSIGGDIALDLSLHHGKDIRSAVVCQAAARTPTVPEGVIIRGLEDSGSPSYGDNAYVMGIAACGSKADPDRTAEIARTRRWGDPKMYSSDLMAWIRHDIRDRLNEITCPVLCVWGDEDFFVPLYLVEETVRGIQGAKLEILEGIGHYPHIETPDFGPLVEGFLNSLPPK